MNGGRCGDMLDGEFCRNRSGRVGIIHDPGLFVGFKMDRLNPLGRHPLQKLAGRLDRGVAILAASEYLVIAVRDSPSGTKLFCQLLSVRPGAKCIGIDIMQGGGQTANAHS